MGIFTYEIVLQDISFLKSAADSKRRFYISAGSYTFQRVKDTAEIVSAGSMAPRKSIKNYFKLLT
jgi:hypothetical protein